MDISKKGPPTCEIKKYALTTLKWFRLNFITVQYHVMQRLRDKKSKVIKGNFIDELIPSIVVFKAS